MCYNTLVHTLTKKICVKKYIFVVSGILAITVIVILLTEYLY